MREDMAKAQEHAQGTTWHLCWQAAVGGEFLSKPSMHLRIRDRLIDAHKVPGRELLDYCLLPTEIHVISRLPATETPGGVARAIGNVVSRWVRAARTVRSPVLAGPFRANQLLTDEAVRQEIRMLAWRPVVLELCRGPSYYPYGALMIARGKTPVDGFDTRPLLRFFGAPVTPARQALKKWISHRPGEQDWHAWELARGLALASTRLGPEETVAREVKSIEAAHLIAAGCDGVDGALGVLTLWVTARLGGQGVVDLREGSGSASARGRALVARIAMAHSLCAAASVARYFGRAKATLSEQMQASRSHAADSEIVSTPVARIISDAAALETKATAPTAGPSGRGKLPDC